MCSDLHTSTWASCRELHTLRGVDLVRREIGTTKEPVAGHVPNLDWALTRTMLEMAVAINEGTPISSIPCVFGPTPV